jgi:glucose dehydrogenase
LNLTTGRIIWGFQTMPHSMGDFDCSWNVMLANQTINGQTTPVVYKGCKSGYVFALSATTGQMLWYLRPPSVKYQAVTFLDPLNSTQMGKVNWYGYPSSKSIVQNPGDTGALESDLAFDPAKNTVFAAAYNDPKRFAYSDVGPPKTPENLTSWEFTWGVQILKIGPGGSANTTVYAIDAAEGKIRWNFTILDSAYRGGMTVSGGVVYLSMLDGNLRMLDENTGRLLSSKSIGGSLLVQPSLGDDANGATALVLTDMGSTRWGPPFPGFIQALAIPTTTQGGGAMGQLLLATQVVALVAVVCASILAVAGFRATRRQH